MNKKSQGKIDLSNPMSWVSIFVGAFILIILLGVLRQVYIDTTCSSIISDRDSYKSQLDICNQNLLGLNDTINNCINLIQKQIDICDSRIANATDICNIENKTYQDYIVVNKIFFVTYNVLVIFLWFPLTIHLFKITFKIGLKKKWEELYSKFKKTLLIVKIVFWVLLTLLILVSFLTLLSYNPI